MSLKLRYILFIGLLHGVMVGLSYLILEENKWYFLGSEVLILFSLYLSYRLYLSFIRPIEMMHSGTDAIADADFNIKYVNTGSKEIDKLIGVFNEMIDRLRIERTQMSEQSYFIQNLIEVTPVGILIMDFDGKISSANPAALSIFDLPKTCVGKPLSDYSSELIRLVLEIPTGISDVISLNGLDKYKCQVSEVVHQGFRRKFVVIDNLSSELLASEKKAFGKIIRMMAHEVNNSMGAVNSILDSVMNFGFGDSLDDQEFIQYLKIAKERNISLGAFMANYASILRLPKANHQKLDLKKLLKQTGQLFVPNAEKKNIKINFDLPEGELSIFGDNVLLEQAISNMIKNAIESIGENGTVRIRSNHNTPGFVIEDNGQGIPEEIEDQIFSPFFSTKPTGQGVGLMLIREILGSHNCAFSLKTDRQTGWTAFSVFFKDSMN